MVLLIFMLSKKTKKEALAVKKIAEDSNPKRSYSVRANKEGTKGVSAWTGRSTAQGGIRPMGS